MFCLSVDEMRPLRLLLTICAPSAAFIDEYDSVTRCPRRVDCPAVVAASMETCRFVALRSPWGRFGSDIDMGNRLPRVRGRSHRWIHISTGPQPEIGLEHKSDNFSIQSSLGSSKNRRLRRRRLPDPRPIPEGVRESICIRKKCAIWTRWRPVPRQNVNYPRPASSRRSGLFGPYTTPPIVNHKYMASTL